MLPPCPTSLYVPSYTETRQGSKSVHSISNMTSKKKEKKKALYINNVPVFIFSANGAKEKKSLKHKSESLLKTHFTLPLKGTAGKNESEWTTKAESKETESWQQVKHKKLYSDLLKDQPYLLCKFYRLCSSLSQKGFSSVAQTQGGCTRHLLPPILDHTATTFHTYSKRNQE